MADPIDAVPRTILTGGLRGNDICSGLLAVGVSRSSSSLSRLKSVVDDAVETGDHKSSEAEEIGDHASIVGILVIGCTLMFRLSEIDIVIDIISYNFTSM